MLLKFVGQKQKKSIYVHCTVCVCVPGECELFYFIQSNIQSLHSPGTHYSKIAPTSRGVSDKKSPPQGSGSLPPARGFETLIISKDISNKNYCFLETIYIFVTLLIKFDRYLIKNNEQKLYPLLCNNYLQSRK